MEAINITSECHFGLALGNTDHPSYHSTNMDLASAIHSSTDSALCAKLLLNQGRSTLESYPSSQPHQRCLQNEDIGVATQERRSRSGVDENDAQNLATKEIDIDNERGITLTSSGPVLVVNGASIGSHQGVDGTAAAPSQFAFPLPPALTIEQQRDLLSFNNVTQGSKNKTASPPSSSSASHFHSSSSKHLGQLQTQQPMSQYRPPASTATFTRTTEYALPSLLPAGVRARMDRDRVMTPSNASDVSEDPLDTFAEGEVLEIELSDNEYWDQHSPYRCSAQQVRLANARCSSSTLFDESRPSSQQGSWSQRTNEKSCSDSPVASPVLFHPPAAVKLQQNHQPLKKDQASHQGKTSLRYNQGHTTDDSSSSSMSCADSPTWTAGAQLNIEPSTPVQSTSHGKDRHIHANSGAHSARGSSPLSMPTTPLTPTPKELDKPTKNLMLFNQIPRQWPSSQETLHHNFMVKAIKKTPVIKDFDTATSERIDRLINKERPLSRATKEKFAAEQKEAELEARGFFDPARRGKGRDVYPKPANWVYCRRTKNNWLEKTKILADNYKLFKGEVLGKGHHADVYKGTDLTTGQDLAIKVIYKTVTRRLGFVSEDPAQEAKNRRLLNEAWFIDYLKDAPGICKILRVVETATKFYFVMELAQSDLNSYSNGIEMREEEIRHILKPIFECLKYAHSQNVTHRDIKPENILLKTRKDWLQTISQSTVMHTSNSNSVTLQSSTLQSLHHIDDSSSILSGTFANESSFMGMGSSDSRTSMESATLYNYDHRFDSSLADWGLAVEHDSNSGRKPVGTPLYAAPEVVRKMKRIRRREWINYRACDIWSLGVTMFVVASGIYPYHTHDALEAQSPPNWALLESSGMSQEYIALTQRLMNLTAELRPSAAEACTDSWLQ